MPDAIGPEGVAREKAIEIARRRLKAQLVIVGFDGFQSTELMTREKMAAQSIVDQYGSALFELSLRLNEVAPQPLYRWVLRRLRPNK